MSSMKGLENRGLVYPKQFSIQQQETGDLSNDNLTWRFALKTMKRDRKNSYLDLDGIQLSSTFKS